MQDPRVVQDPAPCAEEDERLLCKCADKVGRGERRGGKGIDERDKFDGAGCGWGAGEGGVEIDADTGARLKSGERGRGRERGEGEDDGDAVESGAIVEWRDMELSREEPVVLIPDWQGSVSVDYATKGH